jgi:hypothetical protein
MEIGGYDISFPHKMTKAAVGMLLRSMRTAWPGAIVEDDNAAWSVPIDVAVRQGVNPPADFFVYENVDVRNGIDELGVMPEFQERMIYVMAGADGFDFVVGSKKGPTAKIIDDIIDSITHNRMTLDV